MKLTQKLRKYMSTGILAAMIFSISSIYANAPELLHSSQHVQTITKGATYIMDSRLTSAGWQDLHILKVDLGDPNIEVRPVEGSNIGERQTILSLVKAADAVAGVNADFFNMGQENAPSFGLVVEDGKVNHAYDDKMAGLGASKDMGTMIIDRDKNLMLDYFSINFAIQDTYTGAVLTTISAVNKPTASLATPAYLDRSYGTTTAPLELPTKKLYKIVVDGGVVTQILEPGMVADIPLNGYVLIMDEGAANKRLSSFNVGQSLEFKSELTLGSQFQKSVEDIQAGIGGGGLIMKDGQAYTGASHKVSPASRQPRTVIGSSQDGKTLFLVTIDGRNGSIGATHNELVPILKSYGVYTAMHLDGGGSTTFVTREEGSSEVKIQNNPSDGAPRRVTNGIGIFSTAPEGNISKLLISSTYDRTFVGTPISFTLKAVDENNNPVAITNEQIKWTTEGLVGDWKNNSFYPTQAGKGLIVATVGDVEVAKPITVSASPVGLQVTPAISTLKVNETAKLNVLGIDAEGYAVPVAGDQIKWTASSGAATVVQGELKGLKDGQAIISAELKNTPTIKTNISTVVGNKVVAINSLEGKDVAVWGGSNSPGVTGRAEASKDLKYHGDASVKFIYNLAKTANKQVAYMKFTSPIKIDKSVQSVNMWVYGNEQGDLLKIELVDSKGKAFTLQAAEINFKGWKYVSVPIPDYITSDVHLNRLYTITLNNAAARTSSLYFDHVSVTYGTRNRDVSYLKAHEKFDPMHKSLNTAIPQGAYEFTLTGTTSMKFHPLDNTIQKKAADNLQKNAKFTIFSGVTDSGVKSQVAENTTWENKFNTYTYENTQVIHMGTNSGGILKTGSAQWTAFKQALAQSTSDHVIITLNKDPFSTSGFSDSREGALFHEILLNHKETTGQNIVVAIADGYDTDVSIRDGIRYMYINGMVMQDDNISQSKKLRFRITGKDMTYSIEPLL